MTAAVKAAQAELASRVLARRRLLPFVQRMFPQYKAGWVHEDICRRLEKFSDDVIAGRSPRLMLLMPPRAGKSELASRMFPAWHLGRAPDHEFIACSYNTSLALTFSRKVKDTLSSPEYATVFDTRLNPDNQSAEAWALAGARGGFVAAGVGAGITGRGAHVLSIDDPVKSAEDADSADSREKVWDWYGCFHPDTELLTTGGWVPVAEIKVGDLAASMDPANRAMSYQAVTATHEHDFDGALVVLDQRLGASFAVTPNHRVWFSESNGGPLSVARADELPKQFYLPRSAREFAGQPAPSDVTFPAEHPNGVDFSASAMDWMRFLGAYLGDGSVQLGNGCVTLSGKKARKQNYYGAVCSAIGVRAYQDAFGTRFQNVVLARWLRKLGHCQDKFIPTEYKNWPRAYLEALLDGLINSDGSVVHAKRFRYVTTSRQLADDVMEIAVKCGYAVAYCAQAPADEARSVAYHLACKLRDDTHVSQYDIRSTPMQRERYCGKVYCPTVPPHHTVLTRRNGRVSWSGQSTAYTRLAPGGGVLLTQTCWSDDDLSGRLQQTMAEAQRAALEDPAALNDVDLFQVIKYPALAEADEYLDLDTDLITYDQAPENGRLLRRKGEALHPERYDVDKLMRIKRTLSPRFWSALYQQNPVPDDGMYFTKDQFRRAALPPVAKSNVFIAFDFAISEKKANDYTVGTVGLQDEDDMVHVADVVRYKSADADFICTSILDLCKKWYSPTLILGVEDGQIWRALESLLRKKMRERKQYLSITVLKPITDKLARARTLQGRMQQGMVSFDEKGPWFDVLRTEMLRFPAGVHDDQVDALAWMAQLSVGAQPPRKAKPQEQKSWKDRLRTGQLGTAGHMAA